MKFNVEVREELSRIVTVEAPTAGEAEEKVRAMYENSEIVLDSNDMISEADIEVMEDEVPDDFPVDVTVCQHLDTRDTLDSIICNDCGEEN